MADGFRSSAGDAAEGGNFPIPARFVVAKDVQVTVIGIDPEPTLRWREPTIDHRPHCDPALADPERERLLLAAIARIALYANRHIATITLRCILEIRLVPGAARSFRLKSTALVQFDYIAIRVAHKYALCRGPEADGTATQWDA